MTPRRSDLDAQVATAQVAAAERLAETLLVGFDRCADEGRPLTQLQRHAIVASALLAFDGYHADVTGNLTLDQRMRDLRGLSPRLTGRAR